MKVLWVCNLLPPMVAEKLNMPGSNKEGWITGALVRMAGEPKDYRMVTELAIAYPVKDVAGQTKASVTLENDLKITCYGYYEDQTQPENYCMELEPRFVNIIRSYEPDVIHIFGTEYGHTLGTLKAVESVRELAKNDSSIKVPEVLVAIQGVIYRCGEEYTADLPKEIVESRTFRDLLKKDNIAQQQAKFLERGEMEKEALSLAVNVTGRTDFDREAALKINPQVKYYYMNETLREPFYTGTWDVSECDRHTIFVSQADYPLKGFHILLEAMPMILEHFADAKIRVAGTNITSYSSLKDKIKISGYGKYLRTLIAAYHLTDKVEFVGRLDAESMKKEYLRCHTYVCPSSIENSPNSMGEAMLLGVPVVASRAGGIPSMITEDEEGRLFDPCNSEGLADDIIHIWKDDGLATEMGASAMNRARLTHNADTNYNRLIEIYTEITKL